MQRIDLTGKKFKMLTAVKFTAMFQTNGRRRSGWECLCDCGERVVVDTENLKSGKANSCGCYSKTHPHNYSHGESSKATKTKEYRTWNGIKDRCYNKTSKTYSYWGGRGIRVCKRWLDSYQNFLSDMGRSPSPKHSIERINNDGNYELSNCKWATKKQQANNRRPRGKK